MPKTRSQSRAEAKHKTQAETKETPNPVRKKRQLPVPPLQRQASTRSLPELERLTPVVRVIDRREQIAYQRYVRKCRRQGKPHLSFTDWAEQRDQRTKRQIVLHTAIAVVLYIGKLLCWFLVKTSPPPETPEVI